MCPASFLYRVLPSVHCRTSQPFVKLDLREPSSPLSTNDHGDVKRYAAVAPLGCARLFSTPLHFLHKLAGVENTQQGDAAPPAPRQPPKPLDPGVIDAILGKTDAVRMRECLEVVDDRANPLQRRLHAW